MNGNTTKCLNLGSYNYLGYAQESGPCQDNAVETLNRFSVSTTTNRGAISTVLHEELEKEVAKLVQKPSAAIFAMGFGCNTNFLPFILTKGDLVLSDAKNHSSIVNGCFGSQCSVRVFEHNNVQYLEKMIREAIISGQPRTHRSWNRIFILIEGLYSMEGYYCPLPEIVALKKKYKCYLFMDEAHSIGAVGKTGRGIDILMGTFTKSFGAFGGFISGSKELIHRIKTECPGYLYSHSIPPVVCQQVLSVLQQRKKGPGMQRVQKLHANANYFRLGLKRMGLSVIGAKYSPVVVIFLSSPSIMSAFSRECLARKLAVVIAGFPATSICGSRARLCISSAHSKEELDSALCIIDQVCDLIGAKFYRPENI